MIFFPLHALSCFTKSSLAADSSGQTALNADNPNNKVDSLQILAMKPMKPLPGVLPSFLETCKSWPTERAWAYSIGRALGSEKDTLTQTKIEDDVKSLIIHPWKIFKFLKDFGATDYESDKNCSPKTIEENIFPRLFNIILFNNKLTSVNETTTLEEFRQLFAPCVISTEGMITVDIAILYWLDEEIQNTSGSSPFRIEVSVLESLCALSLYPQVEEYCSNTLMKVLCSVHRSNNLNIEKKLFFSSLNIIKQLDPCPIRTAIEKLAVKIFNVIYEPSKPSSHNVMLECKIRLGHGHEFLNLLETLVPAENLQHIKASHQQIATSIPEVFSLNNASFISSLDVQFFQSAIVSKDKLQLKWEQEKAISTNSIQMQELLASSSIGLTATESRLFIMCHLQLPETIWNEIKSCASWKQLDMLMKRLSLTYGMTFLKSSFNFIIFYQNF